MNDCNHQYEVTSPIDTIETCIHCGDERRCEPIARESMKLTTHIQKWTEVCEELEPKHGKTNAMLYLRGYVFGLNHAVSIASRSPTTAEDVQPKCTQNPPNGSHE